MTPRLVPPPLCLCPCPCALHLPEANKFLIDLCAKHKVDCPPPQTTARLLDKVCLRE